MTYTGRITMDQHKENKQVSEPKRSKRAWIGVDLDGTLAKYSNIRGIRHIGKPIKPMVERIKRWQEAGYEVKIFTARASVPELIPPVQKWLKKYKLGDLEVTNKKDLHMVELWDDRAIQVMPNTGHPVRNLSILSRPKAPLLEEAFPHEDRERF